MSAFCFPTCTSVSAEYMFQGGFSLLSCAHNPGGQASASAAATNPRSLRPHLNFPCFTQARIWTPQGRRLGGRIDVSGLLYTGRRPKEKSPSENPLGPFGSVKPIGLAVSDLRGFPPPRLARLACHTRSRLRSSCRSGRIHGLPAMRLRQTRRHRRLQPACRHSQVFAFADKRQLVLVAVPIDANQVAKMDLLCSQ